jgi:predicted TPR repeat methyltransferase
MNSLLYQLYIHLFSYAYVPNWILPKNAKTLLDVGCGQGLPMKLINMHHDLDSTGVEVYEPYLNECKSKKIHNHYVLSDVRKMKFKPKSFDIVMASQVIEHLYKNDAIKLIENLERIATMQVIVSTPIGKTHYETDDGNKYQHHKSYFFPEDFKKRGYKIIPIGGKKLYAEETGLAHKIKVPFFRKIVISFDIFLTPYYLLFPQKADYYFWAYKNMKEK